MLLVCVGEPDERSTNYQDVRVLDVAGVWVLLPAGFCEEVLQEGIAMFSIVKAGIILSL